jgi:hypothetical protein
MKYRQWALLIFTCTGLLAAEDVPAQFAAWGTRGPEYPAAPPGYTEVPAEPRHRNPPTPTAEDTARGFVLFQRRPFETIYHDTVPAAFEVGAKLQAFAAQGQYEPLTLALYGLEDLASVSATVDACRGKDGASISTNQIEIRVVRPVRVPADAKHFKMTPFYMEKRDSFTVSKSASTQLWITVHIPESAPAGDYEGHVTVKAEGKTAATIPLQLRVLPLKLPPIPIETTMSYFKKNEDPRLREKEMIDMREHGILANEDGIGAEIASRDKNFGDDDIAATKKACQEMIALRKKVYGKDAARFPLNATIGHQLLYEWVNSKGWFEFWPHSPKLESDFFKAIDTVREVTKAEGVQFRIFIMDEPGGHPDLFKETVYYNKLVKEKLPEQQTYVTLGGGMAIGVDELGELGPYIDMAAVNRFSPAICKALLDRKKPYGIYNGGGATDRLSGYTRDRYFFGFYCWKTGASEILQWVYSNGEPWKIPIRDNEGYTYPAADGPLPSIQWEGVREGITDYRYTDLLWRLITAAKKSGDAKAVSAAKAGEAVALEIMSSVDFNYQPREGDGAPPPPAATLEKWRWKTASACLELLKLIPLDKALATDPVRPGPLELPGPKSDESVLKSGKELLPDSSFENGPGPWTMTGKFADKSSGIDSSKHHGGAKSFKLINLPEATGMDVAVCVWGWGGVGPAMQLESGKTYEFSAWLFRQSGAPSLRLSLPDGALRAQKAGDDAPDANGWLRTWVRVTMAQNAKPGYFAVWLQGPGHIWVDDMSLVEISEAPIVLSAPQLADGGDRTLPVTVSQRGGSAPLKVRLSLGDTKETHEITVAPGAAEVVDFDPSALVAGKHTIKAEVTEGGAVSTATIERIRGPFEK